jgi:2',3'-cyclic-nucleotide 2'-phosphodiesterase (5'-nucleotidase family)
LKKEGADLIVALAHLDRIEASSVLDAAKGIDLMILAHDGGTNLPQAVAGSFLMPAGDRGRQMMRLDLNLNGGGSFVDLSQIEQAKGRLVFLANQIQSLKDREKREPQNRPALEQTLASFEKQKAEVEKEAQAKPQGRTLKQTIITLDPAVASEEPYKRRVDAFVAKYGPTN